MIEVYVDNIKWSLQNKCFFPALALALTLPDMCGMVEYPGECVGKRYVDWYDKYLGEFMAQNCDSTPWLSGEVVYNLRNTFLHQGAPNIDSDKVNEPVNKLDKFILMLGDGTVIEQVTWSMKLGSGEGFFGGMNHYDADGHKVGHSDPGFFGGTNDEFF